MAKIRKAGREAIRAVPSSIFSMPSTYGAATRILRVGRLIEKLNFSMSSSTSSMRRCSAALPRY